MKEAELGIRWGGGESVQRRSETQAGRRKSYIARRQREAENASRCHTNGSMIALQDLVQGNQRAGATETD
ncbi:hypothetical protein ACO22_00077 [Paracoccidioides brasiliensis]|uniref:Uncharacterized protein n=1 Tax=Paracoccidioides brasiliensis TaxID=121759 RepID=A0A1D2JQ94_PARBR|nr:hypothetical protein ACO22_00077 [Paracoccidioides brasiliensis]